MFRLVSIHGLKVLDLNYAVLSGSLDVHKLPRSLQRMELCGNYRCSEQQLSGPLDLTQLPSRMETLGLNLNRFSGGLNLWNLPSTLKVLCLYSNRLSGPIDLTQLPPSLDSGN